MAIVKMKKFTLFTFEAERKRLLEELQRFGYVNFSKSDAVDQFDYLKEVDINTVDNNYIEDSTRVKWMIDYLGRFVEKEKGLSALKKGPIVYTFSELEQEANSYDYIPDFNNLNDISKKMESNNQKLTAIDNSIKELLPWNSIKEPIEDLNSFKKLKFIMGYIPTRNIEKFKSSTVDLKYTYFEEVDIVGRNSYCIIFTNETENEAVFENLRVNGFSEVNLEIKGEVSKEIKKLEEEKKILEDDNIILTDENKVIIESLKNSYSIDYKRSTIANMNYILPPTESKYNPFDFDSYKNLEFNYSDKRFLMKNFYGVSALLNNYFVSRQTEYEKEFKSFCCNLGVYYSPILLEKNGKKDFYFFDVNNDETNIVFTSLCDLLDFYYLDIAKSNINKSTDKRLFDFIKTKLNRLNKKLEILNKELIEAESKEDYKLKGQLLISNIYMLKKSVPEVATLQNFYSEELEDIKIELDPNLTIEKNSERYFNLYKKNKRTIENLYEQIKITEEDIVYFETLQFQVENADKSDLIEIKEELINSGLLKEKVSNLKKKNKNNYFVINYNGIDIYVGKNNIQNDAITNKLARRDYLWFHTKDIPGSHVVIFNNNPDEKTKEVAAMLAGYFSKFKNEDRVDVDMTLIKNVKKISGAKPGMVTYTGQKTIKQKIDKMFINELINNKFV